MWAVRNEHSWYLIFAPQHRTAHGNETGLNAAGATDSVTSHAESIAPEFRREQTLPWFPNGNSRHTIEIVVVRQQSVTR